jgi:Fuc2NAc and GlcNAc transferase
MLEYIKFLINIYTNIFINNFIYFYICVILLYILTKISKYLKLIDYPNSRSSHLNPTPSGGGIALVLIILAANIELAKSCPEFFWGGFVIALIGLIDDIKPLPVAPRLITQMLVVGYTVIMLTVKNPIMGIPMPFVKLVLFFAGVWFINIYNFMDGIDGLAGGYASAAAIGFLYCIKNTIIVEQWNIDIYYSLLFITIPFLIFNWHPAKIFMGDIGSTFIGFLFFCLGVRGLIYGNKIMYAFVIIMSFFWIDATITLARRYLRGRKIFAAHKEHAFHKAALIFGHWKVSAFMIIVTMFWLNPMAKLSVTYRDSATLIAIIAVIPILAIILIFKPGLPLEDQYSFVKFLKSNLKSNSR